MFFKVCFELKRSVWIPSCVHSHSRVKVGCIFILLVIYSGLLAVKLNGFVLLLFPYYFLCLCNVVYQHVHNDYLPFLSCHTKFSAYS